MSYITGNTIRVLREKNNLTQKELAKIISVSDKQFLNGKQTKGFQTLGLSKN